MQSFSIKPAATGLEYPSSTNLYVDNEQQFTSHNVTYKTGKQYFGINVLEEEVESQKINSFIQKYFLFKYEYVYADIIVKV